MPRLLGFARCLWLRMSVKLWWLIYVACISIQCVSSIPRASHRCWNNAMSSMSGNCIYYLFQRAGIRDRGPHSLRHTLATEMVGKGATFKAVSDVLGHKSITTTLIYAKLDLEAWKQVALPWPGGAR